MEENMVKVVMTEGENDIEPLEFELSKKEVKSVRELASKRGISFSQMIFDAIAEFLYNHPI